MTVNTKNRRFDGSSENKQEKARGCLAFRSQGTADGNADCTTVCRAFTDGNKNRNLGVADFSADLAGYSGTYVVLCCAAGGGRYGKTKTVRRRNDTPEKERTIGRQLFAEIAERQTQKV